jgi:hypothetical protein
MRNRERRARRPFDEPEAGRTEDRIRADDDTISKNYARIQDNPGPKDDVTPDDGSRRRHAIRPKHFCRRPPGERMDPSARNIRKALGKRRIDEQRRPTGDRL